MVTIGADVYTVWNAYCDACADGDGPHDDLNDARAWQQQHNAEHHNEPDREDADYEQYRELRKER